MLDDLKLDNILFLDIETAPQYERFDLVPDQFKELWDKKSAYFREEGQLAADVYQRAGIYSEFGKIICISVGIIILKDDQRFFRLKSFFGDDESVLLEEFVQMLKKYHNSKKIITIKKDDLTI